MADAAENTRPHPVVQLTLMRLRELRREPGTLFWVFGFPILISIALGLAFRTTGPEPVTVGVLPGVAPEVARALADGGVKVRALDEIVRERGARYIDFLIPGLIGMNLMSGSMWGIGWVLVNMRVRKLLKRLLAAPMRRRHLFYAQALARLVIIPIELIVILVFARLAFDVRMAGSVVALALISLAGSASFAGMAILVASRAQNSETVSGLMNLVMLPMFVLSGVFFSSAHFPAGLQPVISILPLTALNDGLRAVIVDGASLPAVARPLALLAAWGGASFAVGVRIFRWG